MTSLTREQELALIEALGNGLVRVPPNDTRWALLGHGLAHQKRGREDDLFELNYTGRLLAQALKDRDEARVQRADAWDEGCEEARDYEFQKVISGPVLRPSQPVNPYRKPTESTSTKPRRCGKKDD